MNFIAVKGLSILSLFMASETGSSELKKALEIFLILGELIHMCLKLLIVEHLTFLKSLRSLSVAYYFG
jgi:hypothetical protein